MNRVSRGIVAILGISVMLSGTAVADNWNERTLLTFSEPVMVPGATLEPGTYIFRLLDSNSARHIVQIRSEEGGEPITITHAVPLKRQDARGEIVLRFDPTDAGQPPALRAWFYPGSVYGHQFIYSDEEARQIANRTKTVVLAIDEAGSDLKKGSLRTYNAEGIRGEWRADDATMKEWDEWQRERAGNANRDQQGNASQANPDNRDRQSNQNQTATDERSRQGSAMSSDRAEASREERREATAPAIATNRQGTRVKVDELENNARKYLGQTISVDAEVEDIYGPRMFTIDEPRWGDLEGEVLVYVPSALAVMVREDDRVTVTGEVRQAVMADLEREWGWLGLDPEVEVRFSAKPIIVATRVVGGNSDVAILIEKSPSSNQGNTSSTATSSSMSTSASKSASSSSNGETVSELSELADGGSEMVGRQVTVKNARVTSLSAHGGFFVKHDGNAIFILPSEDSSVTVSDGDSVSIEGVVLRAPRNLGMSGDVPEETNEDIYVMASSVKK